MAEGNASDTESALFSEVKKWYERSRREKVHIVVVGETGIGKSTLVNGLIGSCVLKKATSGASARAVTKKVEEYPVDNNPNLVVVDTPGLSDRKIKASDIVEEIRTTTGNKIHLLVCCVEMRRITTKDEEMIKTLAKLFQKSDEWNNVIYVLTRANVTVSGIENDLEGSEDVTTKVQCKFTEVLKEFTEDLHEYTQSALETVCNLPSVKARAIANEIPVLPAGFLEVSLPGVDNWLTSLWKAAFSRVDNIAAPAFLEFTALHRIAEKAGADTTDKLPQERSLDDEDLRKINKAIKSSKWMTIAGSTAILAGIVALCTAGGAILGSIGGPVGTAVGAKAGAIVGAKVGAFAGTVAGGGTAVVAGYKWNVAANMRKKYLEAQEEERKKK